MGMEIERKIIKKDLDFSQTLQYFTDHIDGGGFLERCLLQEINFLDGHFFILLPEDAKMGQLYRFEEGGINPVVTSNEAHYVKRIGSFTPNRQVVTSLEVSQAVKLLLENNSESFAFCEDVIQSPKDPHVEIPNIDIHFYEDHVYYSLYSTNSLEEIHKVIRRTDNTWHSLIVLSSVPKLVRNLNKKDFSSVCLNIQHIITSAHDSENFIFWENTHR
jgi:hypothetical protein